MAASSRWAARLGVLAGALSLLPVARADDAPPAGANKVALPDKPLALVGFALGPLHAQCPEAVAALLVAAQQPEEPKEAAPPARALDDRYRPHVAVAEIVGMRDGIVAAAMVQRGIQTGVWIGKPSRSVRPDRQQIAGRIEDRVPIGLNPWERQAYNYLVNHARQVPLGELTQAARHDLVYANLMSEPGQYRGELVHITGRLGRLIKYEAPMGLWNDGIKTLYEGWIYPNEKDASTPYCVVMSEKPVGIELTEKFDRAPFVSCDAFFFKIYRYEAKDARDPNKKVRREAPLFIGRTLALATPAKSEDNTDSPLAGTLIPAVLILVAVLIVIFFVLTWWFRRGDRKVQARIREARYNEFVAPTDNDHPVNEGSAIQESPARGGNPSGN
jgi:hypothetical protein